MVDSTHEPEPTEEVGGAVVLETKGEAALWVLPLIQKLIEATPHETRPNYIEVVISEFSDDPAKVFSALQTLSELVNHIATAAAIYVLKAHFLSPEPKP